ncbi:MAG TPA: hypothetical protein VF192_01280 [Longimicrobiales bacterium]
MSEETRPKTPRKADAEQQKPTAENPVEEARYDRDQLVEGARSLLKVNPLIVQGALGRAPASRKTFILAEASELVREHTSVKIEPLDGAA